MSRADDVGDVTTIGSLAPDFDPDKLPPIGDGRAYGLAVGQALLADAGVQDGDVRGFDDVVARPCFEPGDDVGIA